MVSQQVIVLPKQSYQ